MKSARSSAALLAVFGGEVTFVDTACRVHSPVFFVFFSSFFSAACLELCKISGAAFNFFKEEEEKFNAQLYFC